MECRSSKPKALGFHTQHCRDTQKWGHSHYDKGAATVNVHLSLVIMPWGPDMAGLSLSQGSNSSLSSHRLFLLSQNIVGYLGLYSEEVISEITQRRLSQTFCNGWTVLLLSTQLLPIQMYRSDLFHSKSLKEYSPKLWQLCTKRSSLED